MKEAKFLGNLYERGNSFAASWMCDTPDNRNIPHMLSMLDVVLEV